MYKFNLSKKYSEQIVAISTNEPLAKNKEPWTFFKNDNTYYFIMHEYYNSCAFNYGYKKLLKSLDFNVNIDLNSFLRLVPKKFIYSFLVIILTNHELAYNLPFNLKTKKNNEITHNYMIGKIYISYVYQIENIIYGYNFARKLQLMPNNHLNPEKFTKIVVNEFKEYSGLVEVSVLNKSDIEKKKMGLILGVSQGSNNLDACKILIIKPKNTCPEFTVIGKGITFDTGGVNLKPPRAIIDMQYDMSGASIAVSLMLIFLREKIKPNFNIVVPLAINNIGENSIKVHDVLMSYANKSVEIIDTDAEGRLLLADAISYAIKDLNTKTIVTVATLTGAISVGLGENYTGYWLNKWKFIKQINLASEQSGEYVWNMPLGKCFKDNLVSSTIADTTNDSTNNYGSSSTAVEFLRKFSNNRNLIHFDIAGSIAYRKNGRVFPIPTMLTTLYYFMKSVI